MRCRLLGLCLVAGCSTTSVGELSFDPAAIDLLIVDLPGGEARVEAGDGLALSHETKWRGDTPPSVVATAEAVSPEQPVRRTWVTWLCQAACRSDVTLVAPAGQDLLLQATSRQDLALSGLQGNVFVTLGGTDSTLDLRELDADVFGSAGERVEMRQVSGRIELRASRALGEAMTSPVVEIDATELAGLSFDAPPDLVRLRASAGSVILEVPRAEYRIVADAPSVTVDGLESVASAARALELSAAEEIVVRVR